MWRQTSRSAAGDRPSFDLDVFGRALGKPAFPPTATSSRFSKRSRAYRRSGSRTWPKAIPSRLRLAMFRSGVSSGHRSTTESSSAAFAPACGRWHRLGGPARRILEFGDAPKFSADGQRLVFMRGSAIWTANADGGDVREVSGVPNTPWPIERFPDLSPDGQTIAFFHPTETAPIWGDIWIVPVGGGAAPATDVRCVRSRLAELGTGWTVHRLFFQLAAAA